MADNSFQTFAKEANQCDHCGKVLSRMDNLKRHQLTHSSEGSLSKRQRSEDVRANVWRPWEPTSAVKCPLCKKTISNKYSLVRHIQKLHKPLVPQQSSVGANVGDPIDLTEEPWQIPQATWTLLNSQYPPDIVDSIKENWRDVRTRLHLRTDLLTIRQVRLTIDRDRLGILLKKIIESIFVLEKGQFKIDLAFTTINQVKGKDRLIVRYSSYNSRLFESLQGGPMTISTHSDLEQIFKLLDPEDIFGVSAGISVGVYVFK